MNVELTQEEAEILIAVLTFAEGAAATLQPELVPAIAVLRKMRTALLETYLRERLQIESS
jgi:hypothetical protein